MNAPRSGRPPNSMFAFHDSAAGEAITRTARKESVTRAKQNHIATRAAAASDGLAWLRVLTTNARGRETSITRVYGRAMSRLKTSARS